MKRYERPEMNVTSYEANENTMLTTSGVQKIFDTNNTKKYSEINFS